MHEEKAFSHKEYYSSEGQRDMILILLMHKEVFQPSRCTGTRGDACSAQGGAWPKASCQKSWVQMVALQWESGSSELSTKRWALPVSKCHPGHGVEAPDPSNTGLLLLLE